MQINADDEKKARRREYMREWYSKNPHKLAEQKDRMRAKRLADPDTQKEIDRRRRGKSERLEYERRRKQTPEYKEYMRLYHAEKLRLKKIDKEFDAYLLRLFELEASVIEPDADREVVRT